MKSSEIKTIEKVKYKKDIFNIRWRVTTLCNYQCAFCIQGNPEEHARQARGETAELRNSICDKIVKLVESAENQYRVVDVSLIGGEVTILKDFPDILERLVRSDFTGEMRFSITTNFSAAPDYYQRLIKPFQTADSHKNRVLSLSASFYPEYVSIEQFSRKLREIYRFAGNKKHAFRSLFEKAGLAKRDCLSLSAGIPIFNDCDFDMFVKIKDSFKDTDIRISPIIIRKYDTDLSDETLKSYIARGEKNLRVTDIYGKTRYYPTIQALGASLEHTDTFCPTGYLCDAGIRNIWIDAFGSVKRCPAIGSTMCMGSILDDTFQLYTSPTVCTSDHCSCGVFGKIEKRETKKGNR